MAIANDDSMNWLHSLLVSFISGVLGLFLGGLIGIGCVKWFRITSFEGASGYAMVGIALLGGIVAAIIGLVAARWVDPGLEPSFSAGLLRAAISVGMTALVITGICRLFADPLAFEKEGPVPPVPVEDRFALPAREAPLYEWLSVVSHGAPEATMLSVIHAVSTRPEFAVEAREIIFGDDDYLAAAALRLLPKVPHPGTGWETLVSESGRDISARIQAALARPLEEDTSFREIAYLAIRFYGWVETAHALREAEGSDFKAELEAILEQSETGTDSTVLQNDVCRIARLHLQKWSGADS